MVDRITEDTGRLFEAGFVLGVIRALGTLPSPPPALATYRQQRASFDPGRVLDHFVDGVAGRTDRATARSLGRYYLFKGHLAGCTFLQEYVEALIARHGEGERRRRRALSALRVQYWQCSLTGPNRLEARAPAEVQAERRRWLEDAGLDSAALAETDTYRGGFLNADLLLLVRDDLDGSHDLLCVDVSAFAPGESLLAPDLSVGSELLRGLAADVQATAEKGAFSRLAIETGTEMGSLFTPRMARYFAAFAREDKESSKLIQAGSYARSFERFARRAGFLAADAPLVYHVIGYTERGVSSMALRPEQAGILDVCAAIYQGGKPVGSEADGAVDTARDVLFRIIQRNTGRLFEGGSSFVRELAECLPQTGRVEHTEVLAGTFQNVATPPPDDVLARCGLGVEQRNSSSAIPPTDSRPDLRAAHAALVWRALDSRRRFVFLTGNPGIGKTTAVARYLMERCHDEGYLLFYASPRKAVNRDVFAKFARDDLLSRENPAGDPSTEGAMPDSRWRFYDDRFLGLTTNAALIRDTGAPTVEYLGAPARVPEATRGVRFLDSAAAEALRAERRTAGPRRRVVAVAEDTLRDSGVRGAGVLHSLCTAVGAALGRGQPNALVAGVSIQSYRVGERGSGTLDHLQEIFAAARNRSTGTFIPERMRELAATTRHLCFMIDEVTGDDGGYHFFRRLTELLDFYRLEQFGFQVRIIVADASLNGVEVVRAHLAFDQHQPDTRKIYLTLNPHSSRTDTDIPDAALDVKTGPEPLTYLSFAFRASDDACLVNSNAYPASALHLRYRVLAPIATVPDHLSRAERRELLATWQLDEGVDAAIARDVCVLLDADPEGREQSIVYVQNKRRLDAIVAAIEKQRAASGKLFEQGEHYLFVHADISDHNRAIVEDERRRSRFAVFLVTSSASRGLSFPKARHIFVDVPRFYVETNLMEIVQVIYRDRGGPNDLREKHITFYLSDGIVVRESQRERGVREGVMGIMTVLALLKLCVMTRIAGTVPFQGHLISAIPIGGKSVAAAGRAFHHDMASLYGALNRELRGARSRDWAMTAIFEAVRALMAAAEIRTAPADGSFLRLYRELSPERLDAWLLSDAPLQPAYVLGSLLLVPLDAGETETVHHMALSGVIFRVVTDETRQAVNAVVRNPRRYPSGLHDGVKEFSRLIEELEDAAETQRSQRLEQRSTHTPGYFAVPQAVFVEKDAIAAYCAELASREDDPAGAELKDLLAAYVRGHYPMESLMPIGWRYKGFPFLTFTSRDLSALRAKTFRAGHAIMSREMNLLTMLLTLE